MSLLQIDDSVAYIVGSGLAAVGGLVRYYIRNRKKPHVVPSDSIQTVVLGNEGAVVEGFREIGLQHDSVAKGLLEQRDYERRRAEKLDKEKSEMTEELRHQAELIAELRATVKILEAQVVSLLKRVQELEDQR